MSLLIQALLLSHLLASLFAFIPPKPLPSKSIAMSASSTTTTTLSIEPTPLQSLLQTTSKQLHPSDSGLDLGIVWMEHLNLVVGDMNVAKLFYVTFLGLTIDEGNGKHFNLGQQQV